MNNGLFITIEGGEGAGKTTLIERLANTLQKQGHSVVTTREPGGIPIAEKIRAVILDRAHTEMDPRTEALLYAASRRQHLVEKVMPALAQGKIVLCDRFIDSSLAYQGYARGLGMEAIWDINRFAVQDMMPALTVYLDLSPETGLARIAESAGREVNRLDLESLSFHKKVREGYRLLGGKYADRIVEVNAEEDPDTVYRQVLSIIIGKFGGLLESDV